MKLRAIALLALVAAACGGRREQSLAPAALYQKARVELWKGEFANAELLAQQGEAAYGTSPQWRELYAVLRAEALARRGDRSALALLDRTPVCGNDEAAVRRLFARGYALTILGRYDDAAAVYANAEALAASRVPALRAEAVVLAITPAFRKSAWDRAEQLSRRALQLGRDGNQPYVVAPALGMLGTIETHRQEFQLALQHLNEGLRLARSIGARNVESLIVGNMGWCYMQLGDTDEALRCYREALDYSLRHNITRTRVTWLTNISNVYLARQQVDEALPYAEQAVAAARTNGDPVKLAFALANLARLDIELGRTDVAAVANREATALRREHDPEALPYSQLTDARLATATGSAAAAVTELESIAANAGSEPELRWQAQAAAAGAYQNLGRLGDAARMYEAALDTGDEARGKQKDDSYLFAFESNLIRFYDGYIDLLLAQGRAADALRVAERSRARTLREGIGLLKRGEGGDRAFAPAAIAAANHATILSYWLAPRRSLLWVVRPGGVDVKLLPGAPLIEREVDAYRAELQTSRHSLASARGARLYAMLVAPANIAPPARVIVVPDGHLNAISMETLIAPAPRPHYWLEDATVSYTPSLQLLAETPPWRSVRDARLLIVGNVPAEGREFPALARAGVEISRVARHFDASRRVVIAGTAATPAAYERSDAQAFDFLHFTAHGTASVRSPLDSSVILAPDARGFRLSGRNIVGVPLSAQLVTVSSCNSAGQRSYAGEGLVGLAWAFMRAGAHRVVAAQWDVSDSATPALMDHMYAALHDGDDPAAALRQAKLALLRSNTIYERPLYWAPFVVYGAI